MGQLASCLLVRGILVGEGGCPLVGVGGWDVGMYIQGHVGGRTRKVVALHFPFTLILMGFPALFRFLAIKNYFIKNKIQNNRCARMDKLPNLKKS